MNQIGERTGTVLGRFLLVLIFLAAGFGTIFDFAKTETLMKDLGMPGSLTPYLLVGAIAFEILGGLLVILGLWTRLGAALLIIFLLAVTPIFHAFWKIAPEKAMERQNEMINFMKNLSILGGLLILVARGGGLCSLDNVWRRKVQPAVAGTERKAA
jgi:putative oxidoreductase